MGRARKPAFTIASSEAYVAAATTPCQRCSADIEVICIYCESGTVSGEALTQFTVSNVFEMDEQLGRQLLAWPCFRRSEAFGEEIFANHCPQCGALQGDIDLHTEPDQVFFDVLNAAPRAIRLTPLEGMVRLSGDEHFVVR